MSVADIIGKCERLHEDSDLGYVKEWKKKHGKMAMGYLPVYVPREIIHAAGMLPVGIMGGGSDLEIIRGDAYYQSYICHLPRSVVELGLSGRLDCLDGMLFPAICDVIRNLSGIWKLKFEDKYVTYLDLPQNFDPDIGGEFYVQEMRSIYQDFCDLAGTLPRVENINTSITLYNENRRVLESLYRLRMDQPHLVSSYELYLLMRASNLLEVSEHTSLLREYIRGVVHEPRPQRDNIRVVITGVFCEQPPLGLIRVLEQCGCYIVDDDWVLGARYLLKDIEITDDPIRSIGRAYLEHGTPTASRYIDDQEKGRYLVDRVAATGAEGVVFAAPSFCDPALLERPMLQEALRKNNIPHTSFKYSENSAQHQTIKEQTGAFSDSIKLWGET